MDENSEEIKRAEESPVKEKRLSTLWIVIIIILAIAVIVGGFTYYYLNAKQKQQNIELRTQNDDLIRDQR